MAGDSLLNYSKHIQYWRRCLKTYLPYHYIGNDSNRMTLAFFVLSAEDILGDLQSALTDEDRLGYIEWVYQCQLPTGGFRPWPGTDFGTLRNEKNAIWDPAHVPGTFFALLNLVLLGDDLSRVKRREILIWLNKIQRSNGSFGESLGENGRVEGGNDTRFGYMCAGIRWILRGHVEGPVEGVPDIDVDKFVRCVRSSETYDGGISEAPFQEAHAGFACCAISALYFVNRLSIPSGQEPDDRPRGLSNVERTIHWLASRLTLTLDEEDAEDTYGDETDSSATCHDAHSFVTSKVYPSLQGKQSWLGRPGANFEMQWVGMNGRCNKIADTCYAYWVSAPLQQLGRLDIINITPVRRWLVERTQHLIGGFGKLPNDPPDIYHSYLGLFVLAIFGRDAGLQSVDPALCISIRMKERLERLPWRKDIIERHGQDPKGRAMGIDDLKA
jgi:geranylgeranyl transferase type-1 subunit beta